MVAASDSPRTSITTFSAYCAKFSAACPAEFAPPTTYTSFALTRNRFLTAPAVVDAGTLQMVHARDVQPSPLYAGGDQRCVAGKLAAIGEFENAIRSFHAQLDHLLRSDNLHSETLRLHHRATRQVAAAQAGGKTKIIFNARTQARLPAGSLAIDHHRLQPFGRAIHRSRQPSRARRRQSQNRRTACPRESAGQSSRPAPPRSTETSACHRETKSAAISPHHRRWKRSAASPRDLPTTAQRRSTDREHDFAPENLAPHRRVDDQRVPSTRIPS